MTKVGARGILMLVFSALLIETAVAETGDRIRIADDLYLEELSANVWMHVSTADVPPWGPVSANGLAVLAGNDVILVDTPWNDRQTRDLCDWLAAHKRARVSAVIVCHHHGDNLGGLGWIHDSGIPSYSIERTQDICAELGLEVPRGTVPDDGTLEFSGEVIRVFFPGAGHTADSACVYLPGERILFGGCSVKSLSTRTLGNTQEADLSAWPESLARMKEEFPGARIVVPGHGEPGDLRLIDHTLALLRDGA